MGDVTLSVKGPPKSARRAGSRHGVSVRACKEHRHGSYCEAPCRDLKNIVRWYGERASLKSGRGSPPGSLTFYSAHRCGLGGRRRKRRR